MPMLVPNQNRNKPWPARTIMPAPATAAPVTRRVPRVKGAKHPTTVAAGGGVDERGPERLGDDHQQAERGDAHPLGDQHPGGRGRAQELQGDDVVEHVGQPVQDGQDEVADPGADDVVTQPRDGLPDMSWTKFGWRKSSHVMLRALAHSKAP